MYSWASAQLKKRSEILKNPNRSEEEVNYLGNKGAWVRVVSSVNLEAPFIKYFKDEYGIDGDRTTLAKNFILFGGTSTYASGLRYGINQGSTYTSGGSYGLLGSEEVKEYGYRPMPGITAMTIESTGRMGSLRQATVNFRVSNKMQLDVMDALYFRPGFTLLIEYGHAKYINNKGELKSTEELMIDPFIITDKENIGIKISRNIQKSAGNYGGLLSIITSFNFSMTPDGGYDCVLKTVALGGVMGNYPINKLESLPSIYIKQLKAFLDKQRKENEEFERKAAEDAAKEELSKLPNTPNDNWDDLKITDKLSNLIYNINPAYFQNATNSSTAERSMTAVNSGGQPYIKYDKNQIETLTRQWQLDNKLINQESTILGSAVYKTKNESPNDGALFIRQKGTNGEINNKYIAAAGTFLKQKENIFVKIKLEQWHWIGGRINEAEGVKYFFPTDPSKFENLYNLLVVADTPIGQPFRIINRFRYKRNGITYVMELFLPDTPRTKQEVFNEIAAKLNNPNTEWKVAELYIDQSSIKIALEIESSVGPVRLYLGDLETQLPDLSIITEIIGNQDLAINKVGEKTDEIQKRIATQLQDIKNRYQLETDAKTLQALAGSQSAIELMLRSISLYAISAQKPDVVLDDKFIKDLFSEGAYSGIFKKISGGKLPAKDYKLADFTRYINGTMNAKERLEVNLRYGNSAYLMSAENTSDNINLLEIIPQVELANLFKVKSLPYGEMADVYVDNAPKVSNYISLGLFLMMLNHCSMLYNKGEQDDTLVPMTYVDFNPSTNYYLSSINQFSVNPFSFIMPYYGNDSTYKKLFKPGIIDSNNQIELKISGSSIQPHSIFKFSNDRLSKGLLNNKIGLSGENSDGYIGRTMDTLVNINFLLKIIKDYSTSSDYGETYFQSILENITATLNKSTGYYNAFRLAYSDTANTYMIVDDQIQLKPDPKVKSLQYNIISNSPESPEIPIQGKGSIARSFELRTDISNRISSMLAISTNTGAGTQVGMGKNMGDFGIYNTGSYDRYIPIKTSDSSSVSPQNNVQECQAAINFDTVVTTIYGLSSDQSKEIISDQQIQNAMAYYKDRMARVKNEQPQSVSAMIIPIRTTITMDGFSGIYPFQLFTVNESVLPYRYSSANLNNGKVAFTTTKITHNFSNNEWVTSMDGLMTFLKNPIDEQKTALITPGPIEVIIVPSSISKNIKFTDLDLNTAEGYAKYVEICQNFINRQKPNPLEITGEMMAIGAKATLLATGKYVPPELALRQLRQEGGIGDPNLNALPVRTKNPFNVGNKDDGTTVTYEIVQGGINRYYDRIAVEYLVNGKTAFDLITNFINRDGKRYASAANYESALQQIRI